MRKPDKRPFMVEDKPKASKFGVGSGNNQRVTPTSDSVILCCCIKLCCSKCSSSSTGGGGTANMTKEEIVL